MSIYGSRSISLPICMVIFRKTDRHTYRTGCPTCSVLTDLAFEYGVRRRLARYPGPRRGRRERIRKMVFSHDSFIAKVPKDMVTSIIGSTK